MPEIEPSFPDRRFICRHAAWLTWVSLSVGALIPTLGLAVGACSSDASDSTAGKRVLLHTRVDLDPSASRGFTSDVGWNVSLTRAFVAAGPLYYFDGVPPLAWQPRPRRWEFVTRWIGIATAHAHPQHYQAGKVMGQMLENWSVDLLVGPMELPDGEGVTGTYRSARFSFSAEAAGELSSTLGGQAAFAEGRAEKVGMEPRFFRAFADISDIAKSAANGQVDGCGLEETNVTSDGTITVLVNPKPWFDLVDFSELEVGTAEAPSEFPPDSQPKIAFAQGLAQLSAYKFAFKPIHSEE